MLFALILVSIAFAILLGMQLLGPKSTTPSGSALQERLDAEIKARAHAESELDKRKRDAEELRTGLAEVKEQLKQTKRKLYDQKEAEKDGSDLTKAREQVERQASMQLEIVRAELATAYSEIEKLRTEAEGGRGRKKPQPVTVAPPQAVAHAVDAPVVAAPPPAEKPAPPQRVIRELSDADKEKMMRLEQQAAKDRAWAAELDRELRRLKGRVDTQSRFHNATRKDAELAKDKFKALEKRLNRTLLEKDLLFRALRDLEKKSGVAADRTELSSEEIAASDRQVEEKQQAEHRADQEAQARAAEADRLPERAAEPTAPIEGEAPATPSNGAVTHS